MDQYRIKIVNGIFAGYTGVLGMGRQFIDGASVEPLATAEAQMIAAEGDAYVIDAEGDFVLDDAGRPFKVMPGAMPFPDSLGISFVDSKREVRIEETEAISDEPTHVVADVEATSTGEQPTYSREQLEAVADSEGLRGLREIGDAVGAKGKSIPELIERILDKAGE